MTYAKQDEEFASGGHSAEPWEVEYVHRELPVTPREDISEAIETCKDELKETKARDELLQCVRKKVG